MNKTFTLTFTQDELVHLTRLYGFTRWEVMEQIYKDAGLVFTQEIRDSHMQKYIDLRAVCENNEVNFRDQD